MFFSHTYSWTHVRSALWQGDKAFEGVLAHETLTIGLYDADPCSEEEFVGAASVPLMAVLSGERRCAWPPRGGVKPAGSQRGGPGCRMDRWLS